MRKKCFKHLAMGTLALTLVVAGGYGVKKQYEHQNANLNPLVAMNLQALAELLDDMEQPGTNVGICYMRVGMNGTYTMRRFCDSRTSGTMIYSCLSNSMDFSDDNRRDRCTQ